jgi:RNA polymerase sigma factor (sigma-70 family)
MNKEAKFKAAVEANKDRIYRVCCCYVRDQAERGDVFQEVLIHVWEGLDRFEEKSSMSTWIYRVTVNTCLGYVRTQTRRRRIFDEHANIDESVLSDQTPGDTAEAEERDLNRLYESVDRLLPIEKTLISLHLEDLSTAEMADIVGISEANVRVKLHRIRKKLKEMIERDDHGS